MKAEKILATSLLVAPFHVFAHAGHVELGKSLFAGGSETLELALVACAFALYLLSKRPQASRIKTSTIHRRNTE